ncbi:MAG: hypothetical protein VB064_04820 [Oscillospiraceae bacterium]|nr:hypothetical protein [Oscillospiraceae bacterium]
MSDGSLVFDTKIDTSGMDSGMLKIQNKATKATAAVSRQTLAVQKLEAEMQKLKTAQVPTEQYTALETAMQKADARLMSLIDSQDKYLATGGSTTGTYWTRLQYDIEKVSAEVRDYQAQMAVMRSDGSAFTQDSVAIHKVSMDLDTAKVKLRELQMKEQEAALALKEATSPRDPDAITRATNKASSSMATFQKRITSVLRSALIFTVITQLAAKFRDYVGEVAVKNDELRTALGKLKGALQSAFTPIFQAAIPALTSLANALAKVITYLGQFIGLLFGTSQSTGAAKLKSASVSLMNTAGETSEALDGETASLMSVSDAAKDAEKSMASFDEINQLGNKSSLGGGSGAATIPTLTPDPIEMPTWLTDAAEKLGAAIERIAAAADRISKSKAFKAITDFLEKLASNAFIGALDGVARAFESLAGGLETVDKFTSGDFGGGLTSWLGSVWDLLTSILNPFGAYYKLLENLAMLIYAFFKDLDLGKWWVENVAPWFTQERWIKLWDDVKYVWNLKWAEIVAWWKTSALYKWWTEDVASWFASTRWLALWNSVKLAFQTGWASVKTWWSTSALVRWWTDDVLPWFTKDKWYGIMGGIKEGFKAAFDDAVEAAKGILNDLIDKINSIFSISFEGGEFMGKKIPSFNMQLISLPHLATGAVIPPNREFLAVLGDQKSGTNIEAPLDTIVAAFRQVMREGSGGGKGEAVMEVDGQAFGRLVYKYGGAESKRVGVRLVSV